MCFRFVLSHPIRSYFCPPKSSRFIPLLPKNGSLSLGRSRPQNELRREKSGYSQADRWESLCMCQMTSVDWMCSSPCYSNVIRLEEMLVYVMLEWDSCRNTAFNQYVLLQTTAANMNRIQTAVVSYLPDVCVHMLRPWPAVYHVPVNV